MPQHLVRSFAKINLMLRITGKRPDGFHDLETIMQSISLYDDICLEEIPSDIIVESNNRAVPPGKNNICYKAAELLRQAYPNNNGIRISIDKKIPLEAGLGGGSSNAAAVLVALNKIWGLKLPIEQLLPIAASLGSDVPFFLEGGTSFCRGRGEIIEKVQNDSSNKKQYYIIVKPGVSVSTKWAYDEWDKRKKEFECIGSKTGGMICDESVRTRRGVSKQPNHYVNDFEAVVIPKYPIIGEIKNALIDAGCSDSLLTGSGSAVFGVVAGKKLGNEILKTMREKFPDSFLVHSVDKGVEIIRQGDKC